MTASETQMEPVGAAAEWQPTQRVTRLAPSPTGALHLGNARTFLVNWALARQGGWRIVMRIEDLDGPRVKPESVGETIEILRWLGLDWDGEPTVQSRDLTPYHAALARLHSRGLIYPCTCTRREIEQAQSAPHEEDGETRYPGTCRLKAQQPPSDGVAFWSDDSHPGVAWRLMVPEEGIAFDDALRGRQIVDVQRDIGDFVVATKQGVPSYQLAVVVDDARQGVTDVVRGDDLLSSTARQLWLYRLLKLGPPPRYIHLPLVVGPDGRRLAKRHGDTRLSTFRDRGVSAERIVGLLAFWSGGVDRREMIDARGFADRFDLDRMPRERAVYTTEDEAWLFAT